MLVNDLDKMHNRLKGGGERGGARGMETMTKGFKQLNQGLIGDKEMDRQRAKFGHDREFRGAIAGSV